MDFKKIKLVIWDLDNTFWNGIISEMEITVVEENIKLISSLTDCGIINSICSKNTFEVCELKLKELGIFDLFVFPSIDWTGKGQRIKQQISTMSLRPENVLFIDDDVTNLAEAKHYMPELMVAEPSIVSELIHFVSKLEKKDLDHKRLDQYKILEQKNVEQKKFNSNEDFLFASNIKVIISHDCTSEIERLHELLLRSNQLNYTKKRISLEELNLLFADENASCAYVEVNDKFGDYGIVGFYALKAGKLEHFLFSCRTIGLGIEQYVYSTLNFPKLEVVGEVVSMVEMKAVPNWINFNDEQNVVQEAIIEKKNKISVLIKGPCDLSKSMTYIKNSDSFNYEFTYVADKKGNVIEAHNHSAHIIGLIDNDETSKKRLVSECIFIDPDMFNGSMFNQKYDLIFLSTLIESNYGVYERKQTGERIAFGSYLSPLTDESCWDDYVNAKLYTANNQFSRDYLRMFSENYNFIGKTSANDYVLYLKKILSNIDSKTILCLILGVEFPCDKYLEYDFKERHISHKELNDAIRLFAKSEPRIRLIDLNDVVKSQNDFTNNINHYTSRVYFEIAQKIIEIINLKSELKIQNYSSFYVYFDLLLAKIKWLLKRILKKGENPLNGFLYKIYKKVARKKK